MTPTQINVSATATSAQINVTGNVDWTAEASDGATVSPTSGNGEGVITVSFPANTDANNTKEYSVFVRTEAEGVNDEFEVNITQAKADASDVSTATVDFSAQGYENAYEMPATTIINGVTFAFDKGTNNNAPKYYTTGEAVRMYGSNSMTVSVAGKTLVSIELTFGTGDGSNEITTDVPTYAAPIWSGEAGSVTFTIGGTSGQRRIKAVTVKCKDGEVPPVVTLQSIAVSGQKTEFTVGDTFTFGGTVTASYSDGSTKDVTASATVSTPDLSTAGTKEVTVSYTEGTVTKEAKYSITVKAASAHAGTLEDPFSIADAMAATTALGEGNTSSDFYYTKGIISEVVEVNADYGNATYFISDDGTTGTQFKVFRGRYIGNVNFSSEDQIKVGDEVVINGKLTYYKPSSGDSEIEIAQNNYIYSLKRDGAYQYALSAKAAKTSVSSAAATVKVSVYGNVDWTSAVTNPATLDVSSGSGIGSFNVSIPENTGDARSFVVTVASSKAETVTIRIDQAKKEETPSNVILIDGSQLTSTATTEVTEQTFNGVTVVFSPGAKVQGSTGENRFSDSAILIGKSGAYIYNKTAIPGKIVKFEIYANKGASAKVSVGVNFSDSPISAYDASAANTFTATLENLDTVYDCTDKLPTDAKYFWYQVTNSNNSQVEFRITYE